MAEAGQETKAWKTRTAIYPDVAWVWQCYWGCVPQTRSEMGRRAIEVRDVRDWCSLFAPTQPLERVAFAFDCVIAMETAHREWDADQAPPEDEGEDDADA